MASNNNSVNSTASKHSHNNFRSSTATQVIFKKEIAVIGAGQAGLSSAYYLKKYGLRPERDFVILDKPSEPGGAWQDRWSSLTLNTVNGVHDLPGMAFSEAVDTDDREAQANIAVPKYFKAYEEKFNLQVYRPLKVKVVCEREERFHVETTKPRFSVRGIINATGTWESPYIPYYPDIDQFGGQQLHTKDYKTADEFEGKHVVIVGGGISAIQLLDEISKVTNTTWVTRRPPNFHKGSFTKEDGRAAVAMVEERVRNGLPPESVVSVTGLPVTDRIEAMRERGVLKRNPMFSKITKTGVKWEDGTTLSADTIIWCTGFRNSLDHLAPLMLRNEDGGITMSGRLATQVKKEPRIHLPGYGPSASTIGANRAGQAVARELMETLELR